VPTSKTARIFPTHAARSTAASRRDSDSTSPAASSQLLERIRDRFPLIRNGLLLVVPLLSAAVALKLVNKEYPGTLLASLAPESQSADRVIADWQALLHTFTWKFCQDQGAHDLPVGYRIDNTDQANAVRITLLAPTKQLAQARLARFPAGFRDAIEQNTAEQRGQIVESRARIASKLAELNTKVQATAEAADGAPNDQVETPLAALAASCERTEQHWKSYARVHERLADTHSRRDALEQAPAVKNAVVDPAARDTAYAAHSTLQEDMRHLEIQLHQARVSMLAIDDEARASLNGLLAASGEIGRLLDEAVSGVTSPAQRTLLEQTAEKSAEYHLITTRFAQEWTREFLNLRELNLNPQSADVLSFYDRLVRQVRDYRQASEEAIATLRRRVSTLTERSDDSPATHAVDVTITRRFQEILAAYRDFERVAGDLDAADNYLLNAAIESARGLWHRTEAARREVDAELEQRALRRAVEDRNERISALTAEIDRLRTELLNHVDAVMHENVETARITGELPEHVAAATTGAVTQHRRELLEVQIELLTDEDAELAAEAARLDVPATTNFSDAHVANLPENLTHVAGAGLLAGAFGLLAVLGFLRFAGVRQP